VRNADGVDLINLAIQGCDESGIRISNQAGSSDVRILGGSIVDTGRGPASNGSCINAGEPPGGQHPNLVIDGVLVDDCGFDDLDHGIYVQTPGYVSRNTVVVDSSGNGITGPTDDVTITIASRFDNLDVSVDWLDVKAESSARPDDDQ
jgi:hypothetical protein